jgi:hypothetical protein
MPGGLAASEIRIGASGTIYIAPSGTAGPANVGAAWTGFTQLGFATEDAVKLTRAMETEQVKGWQSISPLRYIITAVSLQAAFSLEQFNKDTLPLWLGGGSITTQGGGSFRYDISSTPTVDERVFGVEWNDAALIYRFVMGRCMVTEGGETTVGRSAAIELPLTISAMTPSSGVVLGYIVTNDSAAFA